MVKEIRTAKITFRVSPKLKKQLEKLAKKENVKLGSFLEAVAKGILYKHSKSK